MRTYDKAPLDATGWPVSGKAGQDVIVTNPLGLASSAATAPDYEQSQFVNEELMNAGARLHGYPPLIDSNPDATDRGVVGGVVLRGYATGYSNSNGTIRSDQADDSVTNPAPPDGSCNCGDDEYEGDPQLAEGDTDDEVNAGSSKPSPSFVVFALAIAVLAFVVFGKGSRLTAAR